MATSVISANLPPNIDPTKATMAYGNGALRRLNRELQDTENMLTRQKAVKALCDYLHDHEHVAAAIHEGIVVSLKSLLRDTDVTCRQLSTMCFYVISQHSVGREAILDTGTIEPLSALFEDAEDICRRNAHMAIEMLSEVPFGADGIVQAALVPKLIEKVKSEHDEIKEYILDTLHFCLIVNTQDALKAHGMEVFTSLLASNLATIRAKAARDIMDLSVPLDGKDKAVEVGTVPALIGLLGDNASAVRANAAGALSFIAVTTQGKYTALNADCVNPLLPLVNDPNSEVRVNALKVVTCLAEAPEGRKILTGHVEQIRQLESDEITNVRKHAEIAVRVITWRP
uniref:Radial spoke protein 14 n=2 Tax=Macrostomum lignano TaxID=282301 RepID=A0A1I8J1N9_9PLAT